MWKTFVALVALTACSKKAPEWNDVPAESVAGVIEYKLPSLVAGAPPLADGVMRYTIRIPKAERGLVRTSVTSDKMHSEYVYKVRDREVLRVSLRVTFHEYLEEAVSAYTSKEVLYMHENAGGWVFETRSRLKDAAKAGDYFIQGQTRTTNDSSSAVECRIHVMPSDDDGYMLPDVAFEAGQTICESIMANYYSA